MSDRFARFINDEVLPAVLNHAEVKAAYPKVAFTDDPWEKAVMGCSSGGAAALTMGWFRPDLFRRLITYSGTFVDQQVATSLDPEACNRLADELNAGDLAIPGRPDVLDVVSYENNKVETIQRLSLG